MLLYITQSACYFGLYNVINGFEKQPDLLLIESRLCVFFYLLLFFKFYILFFRAIILLLLNYAFNDIFANMPDL